MLPERRSSSLMTSLLPKPVLRCLLLLACPAAALLSGCQAVVTGTSAAQIRVIDTSPDASGLDIYQGSTAAAYNLGFGTVTSYISVDPGVYNLSAAAAGTRQTLVSAHATFVAGSQYTLLVGNTLNFLQELVLKDQSVAAPSGQISLRLLDQATGAGPVDVYLVPSGQKLTALSPILTNVVFATNTGYFNVPAAAYTLVIYPAGTVLPTTTTATSTTDITPVASYSGSQVTYSAGSATTLILLDQQIRTAPGVQVISATDFISPSATS